MFPKKNKIKALVMGAMLVGFVFCVAGVVWGSLEGCDSSLLRDAYKRIPSGQHDQQARFAFFGDTRNNAGIMEAIISEIENDGGYDFMMCSGDMVDHCTECGFEYFCQESMEELKDTPYIFIPGNHDYNVGQPDEGALYRRYFGEPYYSFDIGNTLFLALDNANKFIGEKQYQWMEDVLQKRRSDFTNLIVFMHGPPVDLRGGGAWHAMDKQDGRKLFDLLVKYNVTTIYCSHIHDYYEWEYEGVPIYVSGGAGARQSRNRPPTYHYLEVVVAKDGKIMTTLREVFLPNEQEDKYEHFFIVGMHPYYLPLAASFVIGLSIMGFLALRAKKAV